MEKATQKLLCVLLTAVLMGTTCFVSYAQKREYEADIAEEMIVQDKMVEISRELSAVLFSDETAQVVEISSADELVKYRDDINKGDIYDAVLVTDIDLDEYCGDSWAPIGTEEFPFSANFNGNGYRVSNLSISSDSDKVQALFGYVSQNGFIGGLTVCGSALAQNVAGVAGQNDGTIENCRNEAVIMGQKVAAGIAVINNGIIKDSTNHGYTKTETGVAGGIAGSSSEESVIERCTNIANVHGVSLIGGIVGSAKGIVKDCKNIGEIYSSNSYVGGIAGSAESAILNCVNTGVIKGTQYVGGICGRAYNDLKENKNYGEIYPSASYAGGIAGYVSGGQNDVYLQIEKCVNYANAVTNSLSGGIAGAVLGYINIESCYNYGDISSEGEIVGGIVGRVGYWDSRYYTIQKSANYGRIETNGNQYYMGGICGRLTVGEINNSYNVGETVYKIYNLGGIVGNAGSNIKIKNTFNYSSSTSNFSNSVCENVYMLSSSDSDKNRTAASFSNGSVLALLNDNTVWIQGDEYPVHIDLIKDSGVSTGDELLTVLEDANVSEIALANDIVVDEAITISRSVVINGNNHSITGTNGIFVIDEAEVEVKNLVLNGNGTFISAKDSEITLSSIVKMRNYACTAIAAENTSIVFSDDAILTAEPDRITIDSDVEQSIPGVYSTDKNDERNFYYIGNSETVRNNVAGFVIKPINNDGLSYNVYSMNRVYKNYIMVPSCVSVNNLTYTEVDANGNEMASYTKDFGDGAEFPVTVGYLECKLLVMQSGLPTLYIEVDETYGTIDAMHSDPKHDTKAYGQMQIDVPNELVEKYGWDKTYKSKEGDEDKPGTMEIKGRGNSSWNTTPGAKKPYQVKSEKKVDFLGMGKAKTWCLLMSGTKQKFGLDLGLALGIDCTPDSRFVDVFMNGEYYGYYVMTEKVEVKEERVEITDLEDEVDENGITADTDLTGGYLLEIDNYPEDLQIFTNGNRVTIKSPENLDETATKNNNYSYIYNHIDDIFNAIYGDGTMQDGSSYLDHIDIASFVRYYWHQEFITNSDCGVGSTYMYKDSDNIDHKLYAGPIWDSDGMLKCIEGWYIKNHMRPSVDVPIIYNRLMQRKDFVSYAIWYYENGIRDVLSEAAQIMSDNCDLIAIAKDMDHLKWNHKFYESSNTMISSLRARFNWIDSHYTELLNEATLGSVIDVESVLNTDVPYTINSIEISDEDENGFNVNVNLTNSIERTEADKVIVSCYDANGKMITMNSTDVKNPSKTALWSEVPILANKDGVKKIRVFVWKDFGTAEPLCKAKEILY